MYLPPPPPPRKIYQVLVLIALIMQTSVSQAQIGFEIPPYLALKDSVPERPVGIQELYANYHALMQNPDTTLEHNKKVAQRWMAYCLPYLNVDSTGGLTNEPFNTALNTIYSSPLQCGDQDPAEWVSDGPSNMKPWSHGHFNGRVDAVYNNPNNIDEIIVGTKTSGIMRSTNGGETWLCVTDESSFPVLGVRQFLADPDNPEHIFALTGTRIIEGGLIYSDDAGATWQNYAQGLPQFYWMAYHPTIDDVIFAASEHSISVSYDNGLNFTPIGGLTTENTTPSFGTQHWRFYQVFVLDDELYAVVDVKYSLNCFVIRCDFLETDLQNGSINPEWHLGIEENFIEADKVCIGAKFSNLALGRYYLYIKEANEDIDGNGSISYSYFYNKLYKSTDLGENHFQINALSGDGHSHSNVVGQVSVEKCELIASLTDPHIVYNGAIIGMHRWNDNTGTGSRKDITDPLPPNEDLTGEHPDYRCSQIFLHNGQERLLFGNDGGVALVHNGLAAHPEIYSLNGDISITLLHAFNVHEKTRRTVFAYQDHHMNYRYGISEENPEEYSEVFLHEGSFAMIQPAYKDGIVGAEVNAIKDKSGTTHDIVNGTILYSYLGAYQRHYRYYPERFAAGLQNGYVVLNRSAALFEKEKIPFFGSSAVGAVAICQRKPQYIFAAVHGFGNIDASILAKSTNDALDPDPNTNWTDLSETLVQGNDGTTIELNDLAVWRGIRALAVDPFDENLVYCAPNYTYPGNVDETFRVLKSTTGGDPNTANINNAAWVDFSAGLPALPVERLLTVETDNHLIFCATSMGIYYRTDGMSQWECFAENLPFVQITGLQYDYCEKILYASTYGRGLWKTEVNIPVINTYAEVIDQDETWGQIHTIYTDILIEPGNTLTITSKLRMAEGKRIIVKPGAQLIVSGGTLTNACRGMWQGIEVWGNYDQPQVSNNQGIVEFKNGALIENAENAVTLWKPGDWSKTGGIIRASNSTFRNNKRAVEFMAYQNVQVGGTIYPNRSYFRNCTFETNENFPGDYGTLDMVTMYKVNGVRIQGCDFFYNRDVINYDHLDAAIYTIDANFTVGSRCNTAVPLGETCPTESIDHSTFSGFNQAVHAMGGTWNVGPEIKDAVFDTNIVAIHFDGLVTPAALFNDITVGNSPYQTYDDPRLHVGIIVDNTEEYIIEENTLTGSDAHGWTTHGVYDYADIFSGNSNALYKNHYTNLTSASIAEGFHAEEGIANSFIGLRFICNTNQSNTNDFEVRAYQESDYSEISNYQNGGVPGIPAGNTFSVGTPGDNVYTHLDFNSEAAYSYLRNANATDPDQDEIYITPPGTITVTTTPEQNTCPTHYPEPDGGLDPEVTLSEFRGRNGGYKNLYYTYLQQLDQGNTEGMLTEIALTWPNDAWALHDELMARSPYNSETVLIAAADKNILTHGMLLEILLANPDALRSGGVINYVHYHIPNPMPQYMIDILSNAARDPRTVRSAMEFNLSNLHLGLVSTHKRIVHQYLNDTVNGIHPDTLIHYFSLIRTLAGRYQQIFAYTGFHQYNNALAVIDSISLHYKLTGQQNAELANTENFVNFLMAVNNDGRNIAKLMAHEISDLKTISYAPSGGIAAERAENILCFFYDQCKQEYGAPKSMGVRRKKPKPDPETTAESLNTVKVAPNPANTYIEFEYELLIPSEQTTLRIIDMQGKPVHNWHLGSGQRGLKVLDTRELPNGAYVYELIQRGEKLNSGKFIIQH